MFVLFIVPVLINLSFVLSEEECKFPNNTLCELTKCCPSGLSYNFKERRCSNSLNETGFKNCDVTRMHYVSQEELIDLVDVKSKGIIFNNRTFNEFDYCLSDTSESNHYVLKLCYPKRYCTEIDDNNKLVCLKKCCPQGQAFSYNNSTRKGECTNINKEDRYFTSSIKPYINGDFDDIAFIHNHMDCPKYIANRNGSNQFYFTKNGSFFIYEKGGLNQYNLTQQKYCLETFSNRTAVIVCAYSNINQTKFKYSRPIMIFSCLCLFFAVLRFMFCFKTMKLMKRMLVSFCGFQLISFGIITYLQFGLLTPNKAGCKFIGFLHLFTTLGTFLWSNVISFSVWKTLRSMSSAAYKETSVNKKFLIYHIYVYTVAITTTLLCFLDHTYHIFPNKFYPVLGKTRCILENSFKDVNYGYIIYFTFPTSAILVINMIFFAYTVGYFVNVKMGIQRTGSARNGIPTKSVGIFKNAFKMALKLFVLMGCTWFFEIVSSLYDFSQSFTLQRVEVVLDTVNSLQGFLLLVILDHNMFVRLFRMVCRDRRKPQITSASMVTI
nr:G-protein coupled receptor Mth2-like isoform X1 [Onthophagus taurus]